MLRSLPSWYQSVAIRYWASGNAIFPERQRPAGIAVTAATMVASFVVRGVAALTGVRLSVATGDNESTPDEPHPAQRNPHHGDHGW